ncbi:polynucleotide 3'-phosphatase /polynucleotide 5'-hydroxyl-kinase /polynucleotide 2',3'-cyclic phosphate phosphodiesterase [Solirubrobacter pauli]|uniref:Polynucleotide 3'-phosphatase /polynucleotide 5'-hydroxyl-kinase /polynucleotide 2',3'-cyclic phosphate phosphodiesterase n=1 Tax=Solirubrobacter pauli TaxID=166793 RepID=A0A660L512_9ACTN|nr:polynucleotide kinase-phosphatase [Solirubrobacter pauli]RKQ86650.1 polynucleotide 3'-phosphatase /polynucleotide 5'-hydroxyl-kinase /polynucleotide 2',3'-cyclic phosphate phosphodiesterase [Solirubrobacter pauli]
MKIELGEPCLVVLMGASGSGKSTFAARHFLPTETVSSDFCRSLVADDANDQSASQDAFAVLHEIAGRRLKRGRLTVIDATNVQKEARAPLVQLARDHDLFATAIVLDVPESVCQARNATRPDRDFGEHVIRRQSRELRRSLRFLQREGFRHVHVVKEGAEVEIVRAPLWTNRSVEQGPFDIVGDIHGCREELDALLTRLGYGEAGHPEGRRLVFVGDYVDRGPDTPGVLRRVMDLQAKGAAICLPGNHDFKLARKLGGRDVRITHGLAESLEQLEADPVDGALDFLKGMTSHAVLDGGRLVVAHAGMPERYQGRSSRRVREFALYGDTTGETDELGLPVRLDWAADYRGNATVVYGHTPVAAPEWHNHTINIDTGCVFGGALTALRWPERELVSVPAAREYYAPARPLTPLEERPDQLLDLDDIAGKRIVQTRFARTVTVREESAAGAMEVMSRFAIDPRWLVYLPPTMAPTATSQRPDALEYPSEAFAEYRAEGLGSVICEEKHMGSRAIAVVCREESVAKARFGGDGTGALYTRTGRPFLDDAEPALARIRAAADRAGLWESLASDWFVLDCELLPWSAKAQELIERQYAPVGAAGTAALAATTETLRTAAARGLDVAALLERTAGRAARVGGYVDAYRRYNWPVAGLEDLRLAPFHVLAAESGAFAERDHGWHLELCDALVAADPDWIRRTERRVVDLTDPASEAAATAWWEELTAGGGEGMVVKPHAFTARGRRGMAQPGIKCRGREYLRIIYGPEYDAPDQIGRLRSRGLGRKRSLASREFALGIEALERFVRGEPLYRVHECVFAVLALESEPVDPRL